MQHRKKFSRHGDPMREIFAPLGHISLN